MGKLTGIAEGLRNNALAADPQVHDLMRIESLYAITERGQAPSWVEASLRVAPLVVVRRSPCSEGLIPVGVRGDCRSQRWACHIHSDEIRQIIRPMQLRLNLQKSVSIERVELLPALRQLAELEPILEATSFDWGPAGSVAFELASGITAVKTGSDLDIVIFAPNPIDRSRASELHELIAKVGSIDVSVETPAGAFSLKEYVASAGGKFLLRRLEGPCLSTDPWRDWTSENTAIKSSEK